MSSTDVTATTITLAYERGIRHLLTHLCEDGYTFCDRSTAGMETFETTIRGRRSIEEFVDCVQCCREIRNH